MASVLERIQNHPACGYVGEVIFFLFKIGEAMLDPVVRLYIYQCTCIDIYPTGDTCYALPDYPEVEHEVQKRAAIYIMTYKVLVNLPAILLGLFCGAWSDKIGRKLPVMLPCVGTIFAVLCFMASMFTAIPFLLCILVGGAIRGCFGKSAIITMGLHSYITDISSKEDRTRRLGGLLAMNFFGFFAGSLLAGGILEISSFNMVFCTVVFINAACAFIALAFMRDSLPLRTAEEDNKSKNPFRIENVRDSLDFILRPRKNHVRLHLIVLFMTIFMNQAFKSGEADVLMLFVEKSPLNWRGPLYDYMLASDYACMGVGVLLVLPVMANVLRLDDMALILIGLSGRIMRLILLTFSGVTWMVFLGVFIGFPSGFIVSASKSTISKIVSEDEIGKAFSLLSCGETVSNMVGSVILTLIYQATFSIHPGLVFGIDSLFFALWFIVVLFLIKDMESRNAYDTLDEERESLKNYGTTDTQEFYQMKANGIMETDVGAPKKTEVLDYRSTDEVTDSQTLNTIVESTGSSPDK